MTTEQTIELIADDNNAAMKEMCDNIFDSCVTDAPYGLGKAPNPVEVMKDWIDHGYYEVKSKGGFMGKSWDRFVPQPITWKETYRVLKPGAFILVACGTRTVDWMGMSLRFAGFEIKDTLSWHYGQGFPKSVNISKAIDDFYFQKWLEENPSEATVYFNGIRDLKDELERQKELTELFKIKSGTARKVIGKSANNISEKNNKYSTTTQIYGTYGNDKSLTAAATKDANKWEGFGTALKPATEFWILAQKPISESTIAKNILKWGTGALNINACRINTSDNLQGVAYSNQGRSKKMIGDSREGAALGMFQEGAKPQSEYIQPSGRYPSNLIFSHHPDCRRLGYKKIKAISGGKGEKSMGAMGKNGKYGRYALNVKAENAGGLGDENGMETVEDWVCVDDCPIKILNDQSGQLTSGLKSGSYKGWGTSGIYSEGGETASAPSYGDTGGASRFFYCAKASTSERNVGLENMGFEKEIGHNRFDKCETCGGTILQNPDRPSACKCETPVRKKNIITGNYHPTVKPVSVMQYLVKLVTPPGGKVLDNHNGSGTTGIACKIEGFSYVGIDDDPGNIEMSVARINGWQLERKSILPGIFEEL